MKVLSYFLSLTVLLLGLNANADSHFGKDGKDKAFSFRKMKKELNLTPAQVEQLKSFKKEAKDQLKAKKEAMKEARKGLETTLKSNSSEEAIRTKFSELQAKQDEFSKARFEMVLKIRSILTPEQRAKFKSAFEDR